MKSRRTEKRRKCNRVVQNAARRIAHRLRDIDWCDQPRPMFAGRNVQYEQAERGRGINAGGIGAIHRLACRVGLTEEIDNRLHLLKVHLPYHESDHVLNVAYNSLVGGTTLEDIELRRNDEVFLDALGAQRIPDPTTAGDFCRRFEEDDVESLMEAFNETRLRVWKQQPESFFDEAILDGDGTLVSTTGECKEGMDISYTGVWGYHPLVVSLANTQEPLFLVNRSARRSSQEGAAARFDQAAELCKRAGFRKIMFRGDTDFSQSAHLDRWNDSDYKFVFCYDARPNLQKMAAELPKSAWKPLQRRPKYRAKTELRSRPENVKARIVREREFKNQRLNCEHLAEFRYQPKACQREYRVVVLRKNLTVEQGKRELFDDIRYFFYITNEWRLSAANVVFKSNDRCNQENLIDQLKNGVRAFRTPVDNLLSNWAYMVMASLAWSLKAWFALVLPEKGRWRKRYAEDKAAVLRMEFKRFVNAFMCVPAQIVRSGRRIVFRLLNWNPWRKVFFRVVERLEYPLLC